MIAASIKKITVSFLLALLVMGCKNSASKTAAKKVAVVVSTLNNPWFVVLAQTAAAQAEALGYQTKIFDSQNNTSLEADNFENAIASGYDAILFNCTDAEGSVANVLKAKTAGVPVFCMDREVNSTEAAASQILSDSYSGCVALGKYFVTQLNKKGTYIELLGLVGDNNTWNRSKGFHSVVDAYPGLKMVAQQSADFDRNKAMDVMESILQAHPDVDAVFCGNDAMASGAYQALVAANKDKKVKVFGFDGAEDFVQLISEKKVSATGMQFPKVMAKTAALYADEYFKGKHDFPQKMPVAVELVTQENVADYAGYGKRRTNMNSKAIKYAVVLVVVLVAGYNSVYFKKLNEVKAAASAKTFNASLYAKNFWETKLTPSLSKAVEISNLKRQLAVDPTKTFKAYSHALGIGNLRYFLVCGRGEVASVDSDEVIVLCKADSLQQSVKLATEYIFGNAVRDATGLVDINEFKNTMDFNNVSVELNKKIKTEVLPSFKGDVKKGNIVEFVGALELNKEHLNLNEIEIIPVQVKTLQQ